MRRRLWPLAAVVTIAAALVSCSSDDDVAVSDPTDSAAPEATDPPPPTDDADPATETPSTEATTTDGPVDEFGWRSPASGEPIVLGMVNSEGSPGLDFPELRTDTDAAVAYLNEHGGFGGRPIQIEHCAVAGSPETSQACAQELAGKGVELVLLGLDLFPGYDTYSASNLPVVGALPILPGDYSSDALFVTGGNLTTMAAMVALAVEHYGAETAGIISADNAGANGSEASLIAALEKADVDYVSIKGGDNETDAGFQGLMREATENDPDILFSLYADGGCIGAMRARVSLGITTPTVSTPICASTEVIDVVGDDAVGWSFIAIGSPGETSASEEFRQIVEPVHGDVDGTSLGLGALGMTQIMTLARVANRIAAAGDDVTGQTIFDGLAGATDLRSWPNDNVLSCGLVPAYPAVCSFEFPIGEYVAGGDIRTIPGFEAVSVVDYLP